MTKEKKMGCRMLFQAAIYAVSFSYFILSAPLLAAPPQVLLGSWHCVKIYEEGSSLNGSYSDTTYFDQVNYTMRLTGNICTAYVVKEERVYGYACEYYMIGDSVHSSHLSQPLRLRSFEDSLATEFVWREEGKWEFIQCVFIKGQNPFPASWPQPDTAWEADLISPFGPFSISIVSRPEIFLVANTQTISRNAIPKYHATEYFLLNGRTYAGSTESAIWRFILEYACNDHARRSIALPRRR